MKNKIPTKTKKISKNKSSKLSESKSIKPPKDPKIKKTNTSRSKKIIIVDAIKGGEKAGTIYKLMLNELKKSTVNDSHGFSLFDTVKTAQSMTGFPDKIQIYGIEPEHIYLHTELSKPVESAICQVEKLLIDYISRET